MFFARFNLDCFTKRNKIRRIHVRSAKKHLATRKYSNMTDVNRYCRKLFRKTLHFTNHFLLFLQWKRCQANMKRDARSLCAGKSRLFQLFTPCTHECLRLFIQIRH